MGTASPAGRERCLHGLRPTAASSRVLRTCLYSTGPGPPPGAVRGGRIPAPSAPGFPRAQSDDPGLPRCPGSSQATPASSHSRLWGPRVQAAQSSETGSPEDCRVCGQAATMGAASGLPAPPPRLRPRPPPQGSPPPRLRAARPSPPTSGRLPGGETLPCWLWGVAVWSGQGAPGQMRRGLGATGQGEGPGLSDVSQQLVLTPDRHGSRLGAHPAPPSTHGCGPLPSGSRCRQDSGAQRGCRLWFPPKST